MMEEPSGGEPMSVRLCIVVVEDQPDAREMLRLLLEMGGHEVFEAEDGGAAVELIGDRRPHVALIDIGLPTIDGYEVARRIRGEPEREGIVLVALTGSGDREDVAAALDAGFDRHLTKPTDPAVLESLLVEVGRSIA